MTPKAPGSRHKRVSWPRRLLLATGCVLAGPLLAYGAIWAVPSLHRLAAETVIASGHRSWAWLFATPAERRAWEYAFAHTPNIRTVTPITPVATKTAAVGGGAEPARPSAKCVRLRGVTGPHFQGWLLSVCNPDWLHVALTRHLGQRGEPTSRLAMQAEAVAAVNGGGFLDPGGEGSGGIVRGVAVSDGHVVPGFVADPSYYVIGLDREGRLLAGKWTLPQVQALGVQEAVSFKPLLVVEGKPLIRQGDGGWGIAPRTAIGQRADGTVLFLVIDGRQPGSLGATLRQVQDLMLRAGAVTAANLDGGSSATLWYRGRVINHPCCSPNGERYIPTAWVIRPCRDISEPARAGDTQTPARAAEPASNPCA